MFTLKRLDRVEEFAKTFMQYHWTWLYSPHGFIISDDPLVRWHHLSQRWKFGIRRANVEITMPLSTHLCLRMNQSKRNDHGQMMYCPKALSAEYNRRQRLASTGHVYSGQRSLLESFAAAVVKPAKRKARSLGGEGW